MCGRSIPLRAGQSPAEPSGWQVTGLYAGTSAPDVDSELADTDPCGGSGERGDELLGTEPELLRDDRGIGLHDEVEPVDAEHSA